MLPRYYERKRYPSNRSLIKKRENLPSISQRVSDKHILWSWETDLVHFGRRTTENVTTLFNRASKYVRIIKNKDKSCKTVLAGIYDHSEGIKILTMDRGVEFLAPEDIRRHGIEPYYCDPGCPGQKGGCENSNRRLRWWLPKRTDITKWDQEALDKVAENMNNTPRKSIGYLTPKEFYTNPPSWCTST
jgi:IS30 family transposase